MKKYKIDNYIVAANSLHDAVSIVRQIKDAYDNGIILEKHETYKGPNGQFTVVKVRRDNGRIQYVVTSDKRDIDAGDKMPGGTIENDLASAIKTAKEYANARKRNLDDFDKDYARESQAVEKDVKKANEDYNRLGNKSASELFEMMGYKRDGHKYYKSNGSYTRVIVFNDFDDIKYYVLKDGVIPRGWTLTKTKWYDSVKDSRGSDIVSEVKRAYPGVEVSQIAENRSIKGENYRKTVLTFDFKKIPDKFESANRMFSYIERKYSDEAQVFKKSDKTYVVIIFENLKKDSFQKDSVTVRDIIQSLVTEETSAIASYNVALETLKDHIPHEAYEAIKAIRDDEQRHVENLYAVLNGNVTPKNLEN